MNADRIDFYTKVHKGLRASLFALSQHAGAVDYTTTTSLTELASELRTVLARLSAHARHEERFIHPLLAEKLGSAELDAEHADLDAQQARLQRQIEEVGRAADARRDGLAFYRALNMFIARYLEHLDREEATMPLLWGRCSNEELAGVLGRFGASRSVDETLADIGWMLPALSAAERKELIGGVSASICGGR